MILPICVTRSSGKEAVTVPSVPPMTIMNDGRLTSAIRMPTPPDSMTAAPRMHRSAVARPITVPLSDMCRGLVLDQVQLVSRGIGNVGADRLERTAGDLLAVRDNAIDNVGDGGSDNQPFAVEERDDGIRGVLDRLDEVGIHHELRAVQARHVNHPARILSSSGREPTSQSGRNAAPEVLVAGDRSSERCGWSPGIHRQLATAARRN